MLGEVCDKPPDEYDFDSSDEEDVRNTVGNIPLQWYESLAHIGYETSGRPIMKPDILKQQGDSIDIFLRNTLTVGEESSVSWRSVRDPETGQLVILSDRDVEIISKLAQGQGILSEDGSTAFEPWEEWFTKDVMQMPVTAHPPQKRSFIPSLLERRKVGRMVHAIKSGWLVPRLPSWALADRNDLDALRRYGVYMTSGNLGALDSDDEDVIGFPSSSATAYVFPDVWTDQDSGAEEDKTWRTSLPMLLSDYRPPRPRPYQRAPEEPLPGHVASYNPPSEFLLSRDEEKKLMKVWRERLRDRHVSRVPPQMPRKFSCLRHVPFSERYLREREDRVKDLVMAARFEKQRVVTTPESVLPPLPNLSQLRPYPTHSGLQYCGHRGRVTSLSVSPCGQWLASISPCDGCLRIWETSTNYCFRNYQLLSCSELVTPLKKVDTMMNSDQEDDEDNSHVSIPTALVAWNPKSELHLLCAAIGKQIFIINPALCDRVRVSQTDASLLNWWSEYGSSSQLISQEHVEVMDVETSKTDDVEDGSTDKLESTNIPAAKWLLKPPVEKVKNNARSRTLERNGIIIEVADPIVSLDWHPKGDYLLTLSKPILSDRIRSRSAKRLLLHRLSKVSSQAPLADMGKPLEWVHAAFHPTGKPHLFITSPHSVRILDLVQQKELRCLRLDNSSDCISSMVVHPTGDHFVAGTYGGRFNWFDIELGNVAFKRLQLKHGTIRDLAMHTRRPLVSVAFSDGTLLIIHCKVTDDLLSKPVIIPVQLIHTDQSTNTLNVFATTFHNRQPHVYTGGEDGSIKQFVARR